MKLEVAIPTQDKPYYTLEWYNGAEKLKTISLYEESFKALEDYFKPKKQKKVKQPAPPPTLEEVKAYFKEKGYVEDSAIRFFKYYTELEWFDTKGNPVMKWKAKAISTWMKPEYKLKVEIKNKSSFFES